MLRVAVVLSLVVLTPASPWLCCCSLARLLPAPGPVQKIRPSRPANPEGCCCCQQERQADEAAQAPKQPARPHPCPCQRQQSDLVFLSAADPGASRALSDPPAPALEFSPAVACPGASAPRPEAEGWAVPWRRPRDLLHLLHVLHC